jgi:hypothetical protein
MEENALTFSISPNPSNDAFYLHSDKLIGKTYQLVSINGQLMEENTIQHNNQKVSVSSLANGIYFVRIPTEDGIAINKLIVQH